MKLVILLLSLVSVVSVAKDELKQDHKFVSAYPGSKRVISNRENYERIRIPLVFFGFHAFHEKLLPLEGMISTFAYDAPAGRSRLEIFHNYKDALVASGFAPVPTNEATPADANARVPLEDFRLPMGTCDDGSDDHTSYFVGRKIVDNKPFYTVVYSTKCNSIYPDIYDGVRTFVIVIEPKSVESGKVIVGAVKMSSDIRETGHTVLQGIEFDFNSATIRKESEPALKQVVQLLSSQKDLRLYVVGHTDMIGTPEFNLKLAQNRAASVVKWLETNGVAKKRLIPQGVGFLAPKANNRDDAGKSTNRRVELIEIVGK